MWSRKLPTAEHPVPEESPPQRLKEALRKARVDQAERTGVVVDLHDAEVARLELLNEALERLIERERALSGNGTPFILDPIREAKLERRRRRRYFLRAFLFGLVVGLAALVTAALLTAPRR